jgi:hypothetical protein
MSNIIKVTIENEEIPVLILRDRLDHSKYKKLMYALLERLTPLQINNIIARYNNKAIILFDNLKLCFQYEGLVNSENKGKCICGKSILHEHVIINKETKQQHMIGSTCVEQWSNLDSRSYTASKRKKLLKLIFNILAEDYKKLPRLKFGKCKGKTFKSIAQKEMSYCTWLLRGNITGTVRKNILNAINSLK